MLDKPCNEDCIIFVPKALSRKSGGNIPPARAFELICPVNIKRFFAALIAAL